MKISVKNHMWSSALKQGEERTKRNVEEFQTYPTNLFQVLQIDKKISISHNFLKNK
jgi:hypothetical protein